MGRVTLLTDFGTSDGYVAAMKGVLTTGAPSAVLDDAGHDLPRGDVSHAAWTLRRYWGRYPEGTVHLVVVDPGVGTGRRALAVEAGGRLGVGPDNGVFGLVVAAHPGWRAVSLPSPEGASSTFHGRDVFAPAAARLAAGASLDDLGESVDDLVRLPTPEVGGDGRVRTVDRFGNLVTDVPGERLAAGVEMAGRRIGSAGTYGEVAIGALVALVGSDGTVEVAVRDGSAAERLGVGVGEAVRLL
ncbi:MAG: SAM-dependent chlorinase/fluorinase [Longimicrobiales bacterium]